MSINFTLTVEYRTRSQTSAREICGGKSSTGTVFCQNASDFPCPYHPTNAPYFPTNVPHTSLSCYLSYRKGERGKPKSLQTKRILFRCRAALDKRKSISHCFFSNVRTFCLVFRSKYVSVCVSVTPHWRITDCHKLRRIVDVAVDRFSSQASLLSPAVSVV